MNELLKSLPSLAKEKEKENKRYFQLLKKKPPKQLDVVMQQLHDEAFTKVDCLDCANCCKTTGPLFTQKDIDRIARYLRIKPKDFEDTYLRIDEDNDWVLQSVPCSFLSADNRCIIYDVRPKACAEFPHTNRKKFNQLTNITLNNISVCPAVFQIVEKMKQHAMLKR